MKVWTWPSLTICGILRHLDLEAILVVVPPFFRIVLSPSASWNLPSTFNLFSKILDGLWSSHHESIMGNGMGGTAAAEGKSSFLARCRLPPSGKRRKRRTTGRERGEPGAHLIRSLLWCGDPRGCPVWSEGKLALSWLLAVPSCRENTGDWVSGECQ